MNDDGTSSADAPVTRIVVVGGGTAGWLATCLIAARADRGAARPLEITLVESPDVPTIGVGEGTWPTMRRTLERIGISEAEFLLACDASFKQGSRFVGWRTGAEGEAYLHPFTAPVDGDPRAVVRAWQNELSGRSFADAVTAQAAVCARDLAPRQRAMPGYAGALNYAYHLDAGKFAALLARHGTTNLSIRHVRDHVVEVVRSDDGIASLKLRNSTEIAGDLFIDCTGHAALLIGETLGVPFIDRSAELFNDRALAVQIPVAPDTPIASQTNATAHAAGWIWDIGLPSRRGIGCVFSSAHMSDDQAAEILQSYVGDVSITPRRLTFRSGHRERFWASNCLAVGLSAGFLEPLEASAIVLIELSVEALLENFPATRAAMTLHADRFNTLFRYRWDRIVEFLKLHYILSEREEPYWQDHRQSVPPRLIDLLNVWRHQPPSRWDLPQVDEVFPAASYQYVLYGMGFPAPQPGAISGFGVNEISNQLRQSERRARTLTASLPTNRAYLSALAAAAQPPVLEQIN